MAMIDGSRAHEYMVGELLHSSEQAGWQSLPLRYYKDLARAERVEYPPNSDQHIALVVSGGCKVQSRQPGGWRSALYLPGDIGMTAPGEPTHLRWTSEQGIHSLHAHLPGRIIHAAREDVRRPGGKAVHFPDALSLRDPVLEATLLGVHQALQTGADDLYAQAAAHWMAMHLLVRHGARMPRRETQPGEATLARVDDYLRANLAAPLTLEAMAAVGQCSVFQLIRLARRRWGETPFARVNRLRLEQGRRMLTEGGRPVIEVAMECGYRNPSHFATAFKRRFGRSPSAYRAD